MRIGVNVRRAKFRERQGRQYGKRMMSVLAGGLAAALLGGVLVTNGAALPAAAAEDASILISKKVNDKKEVRDLRPGDSVTYRVEFIANDEDADGPAIVVDTLPTAFAGWNISGLIATFDNSRTGVTLDVPGITSGASPADRKSVV